MERIQRDMVDIKGLKNSILGLFFATLFASCIIITGSGVNEAPGQNVDCTGLVAYNCSQVA